MVLRDEAVVSTGEIALRRWKVPWETSSTTIADVRAGPDDGIRRNSGRVSQELEMEQSEALSSEDIMSTRSL